jgi:pyruvate ferredoxin oxidoreductase gamma subunit
VFELRIHGRGGQGVVTAAELLALAAFREGLQAQAFPSFGSERMGAPVVAFCRLDRARIRRREPIAEPDAVLVQDPTLLHHVDVFGGLRPDGFVLINSKHPLDRLGLAELRDRLPREHAHTVPASELARAHIGRPIPNVAMLGALCALASVVGLEALQQAIGERFGERAAAANLAAARDAYEQVRSSLSEGTVRA